jgi:flagellar FliL protein
MKKLILFVLLPLLLLGGAGGAAWFFFFRAPPVGEEAAAEGDAAAAKGEHAAKTEAEGEGAPGTVFLDIGEIIVPVYNREGRDDFMVVRLSLEVGEVMSPEEIRALMPRLLDAYVNTLSTLAGRGEFADEGRRNIVIKRALRLATDRILGPDAVTDVLLQRAWQQPM